MRLLLVANQSGTNTETHVSTVKGTLDQHGVRFDCGYIWESVLGEQAGSLTNALI